MKTIVFSCKYNKLLPYFAHQYNKYATDFDEVVVLSPRPLPKGLPDNFTGFQLPGYSLSWCNDLKPFFEQFKEEYFFACMEDHFLYDYVDQSAVWDGIRYMEERLIDKMGFQIGKRSGYKPFEHDSRYYSMTPECNLVSSLQPSIWRTNLFVELLHAGKNLDAWAFETSNNDSSLAKNWRCIYRESPEPWPVADVVRRRRPNKEFWDKRVTCPEDREVFEQATAEVFK